MIIKAVTFAVPAIRYGIFIHLLFIKTLIFSPEFVIIRL